MKKTRYLLIALGLFAVAAFAQTTPVAKSPPGKITTDDLVFRDTGTTQTSSSPEDVAAIKKERDDAKAQAATVPQLQQQINYLQILAERNELGIRVLNLTAQLNEALNQARSEKARADGLQAMNDALTQAKTNVGKPETKK